MKKLYLTITILSAVAAASWILSLIPNAIDVEITMQENLAKELQYYNELHNFCINNPNDPECK